MKKIILLTLIFINVFIANSQMQQYGTKIRPNNLTENASFGSSVATSSDGKILLIGAQGHENNVGAAWIYTYDGLNFQNAYKLTNTSVVGNANFGQTVLLSNDGKIAAIGATSDNNSAGAVWVFSFDGFNYNQLGNKLTVNDASNNPGLGISLSLSNDNKTLLVGGYNDNFGIGAAWIFTFNGSNFVQFGSKLTVSGIVGNAYLGSSNDISSDGKTLVLGGYYDNNAKGAVWIFTFNGTNYEQYGDKLTSNQDNTYGYFGQNVKLSDDAQTLLIASPLEIGRGAVYVYSFNGFTFNRKGNKLLPIPRYIHFGYTIDLSVDGNIVAVSSNKNTYKDGIVELYTFDGNNYTKNNTLIAEDGLNDNNLGTSINFSNDNKTIIAGGALDDVSKGSVWVFRERLSQTITGFDLPKNKFFGDAPISLTSSPSSSLPPSYRSSGIGASLVDNNLYFIGKGLVTVTASQVGNLYYKPAPDEIRIITITGFNEAVSDIITTSSGNFATSLAGINAQLATIVSQIILISTTGNSGSLDEINTQLNSLSTQINALSASQEASITGLSNTLAALTAQNQMLSALLNSLTVTSNNFTVSPLALDIESYPSNYGITIQSNCDWSVVSTSDYVKINPTTGVGNAFVNVSIKENAEITNRNFEITFLGCNLNKIVSINQNGKIILKTNNELSKNIKIFPNPNNGSFSIENNSLKAVDVLIYTIDGIEKYKFLHITESIKIGDIPKGYYIVKIKDDANYHHINLIVQ